VQREANRQLRNQSIAGRQLLLLRVRLTERADQRFGLDRRPHVATGAIKFSQVIFEVNGPCDWSFSHAIEKFVREIAGRV